MAGSSAAPRHALWSMRVAAVFSIFTILRHFGGVSTFPLSTASAKSRIGPVMVVVVARAARAIFQGFGVLASEFFYKFSRARRGRRRGASGQG